MLEKTDRLTRLNIKNELVFFSFLDRELLKFSIFMTLINLIIPPGIVVYSHMIDENYWTLFWGEDNLITWFSSVQLILIGLVAYLNIEASSFMRAIKLNCAAKHQWAWLIFMFGFLFLSLDERFRIHEVIRDDFLKPDGILVGLTYLRASDVGLYFYFIVGLTFSWFLLSELRIAPLSLLFFVSALVMALSTVVIDSLPENITHGWPMGVFWTSAYEETAEIWAQLLFLLSFLIILRKRVQLISSHALQQCDSSAN